MGGGNGGGGVDGGMAKTTTRDAIVHPNRAK